MNPNRYFPLLLVGLLITAEASVADWAQDTVDFRYSPPQWQTAICLPDDPQKSLVDKSGELLYHYNQGGREFGTRIAVMIVSNAVWQKQELYSPRVPIVRTYRTAPGLEIVEEAFAVTGSPHPASLLQRTDGGDMQRNWAAPVGNLDASLKDIALHNDGSIKYAVTGKRYGVALALCEGYWDAAGKRVQTLRVEGAEPKTVDTVADIGKNKVAVFWFDAKDVNGDGKIDIAVDADRRAADKNTILNGLWVFGSSVQPDSDALLAGKLNAKALARMDRGATRSDMILVRVTNTGKEPRTLQPQLIVDTKVNQIRETISSSLQAGESLTVPVGESIEFCVMYGTSDQQVTLAQAKAARAKAVAYWEHAPLPFGRVQVPDAGIQALVDSSIRNIWQAREIKNGKTAFQVGPTCYRGLWIVDGAFLLEAAAMLGTGDQARDGIAYELTHQKPDGRIEVMGNYWKENGIVLWTCIRHAQLTQDKAWLESVWPKLEGAAGFIKELRKRSRESNTPLAAGLNPPGTIDGGLWESREGEFSNVHWNLLGLRAFIQAARWIGKTEEANAWQTEYDDFMATFRIAATRDMQKDSHGNSYVPILMGTAGHKELPQRAQWTFCHAVYPGQLFPKDDPLVVSTLAMLEATEREDMVYGTGWDATGLWNYFASFYGHAWLWQGNGRKAAQVLYAYANHAAPVLDWREEQSLKGTPFKMVGDMPHNWASAEFIRLTIHLLALDRGDELHLFEGMPAEWMKPGMVTKLTGIATPFGKLTMELKITGNGKSARLHIEPLSDTSCKKIVVHLGAAPFELNPTQRQDRTIPLNVRRESS